MELETVGIEWVDGGDGRMHSRTLAAAGDHCYERARPTRRFGSYYRQRHHTGWYWAATTESLVGFESWLERDRLMLLDHDSRVSDIASQPFRLSWPGKTRRVTHVPDYFVRLSDGSALVVDVRPAERVGPEDESKFAMTRRICLAMERWDYWLLHEPEPVRMANIRWLAGYRHPRNVDSRFLEPLLEVFSGERSLVEGVEAVGDPLLVLPTCFHLLWRGDLLAKMDMPFDDRSTVSVAKERA